MKTRVWLFPYHRNRRALASTPLQNKHRGAFVPFSQHAISCKWAHLSPVPVKKRERRGVFLRSQQVGAEQGQAQGLVTQGWIHSHVPLTVMCSWLLRPFQEVVNILGSCGNLGNWRHNFVGCLIPGCFHLLLILSSSSISFSSFLLPSFLPHPCLQITMKEETLLHKGTPVIMFSLIVVQKHWFCPVMNRASDIMHENWTFGLESFSLRCRYVIGAKAWQTPRPATLFKSWNLITMWSRWF